VIRYWLILGLDIPVAFQILARGWLFAGYGFWFVFGMVFGFQQARFKAVFARWRWFLLAGTFLAMGASMFEWEVLLRYSGQPWISPRETLLDQVYALFFLAAFIGFENTRLPWSKTFNYLGANSFGVYLVHTLGLVYAAKVIYRFAPAILGMDLVFQLILYAAGLGTPLILMWIVDHSPARRLYSTIFG
jgi:hypothetical protein